MSGMLGIKHNSCHDDWCPRVNHIIRAIQWVQLRYTAHISAWCRQTSRKTTVTCLTLINIRWQRPASADDKWLDAINQWSTYNIWVKRWPTRVDSHVLEQLLCLSGMGHVSFSCNIHHVLLWHDWLDIGLGKKIDGMCVMAYYHRPMM